MKNLIIVVLLIACTILSYLQFGTKTPVFQAPEAQNSKKSATQTIQSAEIDGIALSTPLESVDNLLEQAGYTCSKQDNAKTGPEINQRSINWNCKNEKYNRAQISIIAKNNQIKTIRRTGEFDPQTAPALHDKIDEMKANLETRENMVYEQRPGRLSFNVSDKQETENKYLRYNLVYYEIQDADGNPVGKAELTAIINVQ